MTLEPIDRSFLGRYGGRSHHWLLGGRGDRLSPNGSVWGDRTDII
ncbi:MAG: hypothetical protein U7126_07070 [Microcoleus sp.]